MTKTAYISGPISGLTNGNFDAFANAQRELEKSGYVVMNPHEIARDVYLKWSTKLPQTQIEEKQMWKEFMIVDIQFLVRADCVFVLDNWQSSNGSNLELLIAQKLNIPIFYMRDKTPFDVTFQISKFDKIAI